MDKPTCIFQGILVKNSWVFLFADGLIEYMVTFKKLREPISILASKFLSLSTRIYDILYIKKNLAFVVNKYGLLQTLWPFMACVK